MKRSNTADRPGGPYGTHTQPEAGAEPTRSQPPRVPRRQPATLAQPSPWPCSSHPPVPFLHPSRSSPIRTARFLLILFTTQQRCRVLHMHAARSPTPNASGQGQTRLARSPRGPAAVKWPFRSGRLPSARPGPQDGRSPPARRQGGSAPPPPAAGRARRRTEEGRAAQGRVLCWAGGRRADTAARPSATLTVELGGTERRRFPAAADGLRRDGAGEGRLRPHTQRRPRPALAGAADRWGGSCFPLLLGLFSPAGRQASEDGRLSGATRGSSPAPRQSALCCRPGTSELSECGLHAWHKAQPSCRGEELAVPAVSVLSVMYKQTEMVMTALKEMQERSSQRTAQLNDVAPF